MKETAALALVICIGLASPAAGQAGAPRKGVTGRAAVYSRTVTAVITVPGGKPLAAPPSPGDLEVLEDGLAATVTAVEALAPATPPVPSESVAPAAHATPATEAAEARPVPQLLWIDLALLRRPSVKEVAVGFRRSLDRLLANGPIEIVVASPEPKVWVAMTDEKAALARALDRIAAEVAGQDLLGQHRRLYVDWVNLRAKPPRRATGEIDVRPEALEAIARGGGDAGASDVSGGAEPGAAAAGLIRSYAQEEIELVANGLRRMTGFTEGLLGTAPRVLYLASDGFDMDPMAFYSRGKQVPGTTQVAPRVLALVKQATEALARSGWVVVPVTPGASVSTPSSGASAETAGIDHFTTFEDPLYADAILKRPIDSLRQFADDTGGDVVVDLGKVGAALPSLSRTFTVAYSIDRAPDGKVHRLEVRSRRPGLVVTVAPTVASGTLEGSATRRGIDLLSGGAAGELPVAVSCGAAEPAEGGRVKSELTVKVKLATARNVLSRLGAGSLRFSLVVEVPGHEPVSHHEVVSLPETLPDVFSLKLPLGRAKEATRVAVVVEELATGIWGAGLTSLTGPPATISRGGAPPPAPRGDAAGSSVAAAP